MDVGKLLNNLDKNHNVKLNNVEKEFVKYKGELIAVDEFFRKITEDYSFKKFNKNLESYFLTYTFNRVSNQNEENKKSTSDKNIRNRFYTRLLFSINNCYFKLKKSIIIDKCIDKSSQKKLDSIKLKLGVLLIKDKENKGFSEINSLINKIKELETKLFEAQKVKTTNYNIYVFTSQKSFELLDRIVGSLNEKDNRLAEISFVYRMMEKDGLLVKVVQEVFKNEIQKLYGFKTGERIKSLNEVSNRNRLTVYNNTKALIQLI